MSSQKFYFFRHGLATRSTSGYGDKILSAQLLPEGVPAITKMAEYLKTQTFEIGFRSEFIRCQQTADIVSKITGHDFSVDQRLNEFHLESFDKFTTRIEAWLSWIQSQPYQNIWVCTHGAVIAAAKNFLTKGFYELEDELDYPYTGELWTVSNSSSGQTQVVRHDFNVNGPKG